MTLHIELDYFKRHLDEFCRDHLGEFVAIKGERVVGFFPDELKAFVAILDEYGPTNSHALIKKVAHTELPVSFY